MLEILLKVLFFLSMLVVYAYVTSTNVVIVIVAIYVACVLSYYNFDYIQATIDQWSHYLNLEARFNDSINPSHLSAYFVNRKFNKMGSSNTTMSSSSGKKIFNSSCNPDVSFAQENCPLETRGSSAIKTNVDLPSPIMKSSSRSSRLSRDGLKLGFSTKSNGTRKNPLSGYGSVGPNQRYNAMDLETYMNVNSPGFTSRVVDKATESASYHIKYPAVRQIPAYRFDKSTLRQLSKIPKANFSAAVRIAPPELNNVEFAGTSSVVNEPTNDNFRNNDYLQVLRDISRKRNYSQEEMDRSITTPKKSRKSDAKNAISSQYKRAHEDCSNDSIDDQNCKKRCDDVDRNYAKMMSFTSSISVLVPEFSWSSSTKKRKSSRLDKSENESPEKIEKCRKIDEEPDDKTEEDESGERTSESEVDSSKLKKHEGVEIKHANNAADGSPETDETDSFASHNMSIADDNEEYVRVAGGKILNRTNCTYRKKLNSTKIDPVSVISTEPEYVSDTAYVDDKIMKENLLNNLMNDIERKGEKDDKVIFYQNSIVEEIKKQSTAIEVQKTNTSVLTSSSFNPLLPTAITKPTITFDQTDASLAPSAIQQTQPAVSLANPMNAPQVPNTEQPVEVSKTILTKSSDKNESISDAPSCNFVASVSSASNPLFQSLTSPSTNVSQSQNSTSASPQFNISIPKTTKPSDNYFSPVFGGFGNAASAPVVSNISNKTDNAISSVTASSNSPALNLVPQPKPAANNSLLGSTSAPSASSTSSVSPSTSVFTSNSSMPSFSMPNSTVTNSNSTNQNQETTFTFGSKSAPTFQQGHNATSGSAQMSVFNSGTAAPTQSSVFGNPPEPNAQSNIFGTMSQSSQQSTAPPSIFGSSSQTPSIVPPPSIFGSQPAPAPASTQSAPQTSMFGSHTQSTAASTAATFSSNVSTQSSTAAQSSVFGNANLFQSQPSAQAQVPTFGSSGDLSSNVFGQSPTAAPRVGVVNPLPQAAPQFGASNAAPSQFGASNPSSRFTFGSVSNLQPTTFGAQQSSAPPAFGTQQSSAPVTFGAQPPAAPAVFGTQQPAAPAPVSAASMQSPFGAKPAAPSTVGAISSGTPQFNFSAPSPFGSAANSFNAAPATGGPFNFGASNAQPSQPAFQFGSANPAPASNQPFMFGGNAAPVPNAGGFSIGSGGSTGRSRAMARPRKVK